MEKTKTYLERSRDFLWVPKLASNRARTWTLNLWLDSEPFLIFDGTSLKFTISWHVSKKSLLQKSESVGLKKSIPSIPQQARYSTVSKRVVPHLYISIIWGLLLKRQIHGSTPQDVNWEGLCRAKEFSNLPQMTLMHITVSKHSYLIFAKE